MRFTQFAIAAALISETIGVAASPPKLIQVNRQTRGCTATRERAVTIKRGETIRAIATTARVRTTRAAENRCTGAITCVAMSGQASTRPTNGIPRDSMRQPSILNEARR